jgi:WD40 repeat protein
VFRDQSDIGTGDYHEVIERALAASRTLVVICSPAARASAYVGDEIARFRRLRPDGRILPVLLDGVANNEATPADADRMAFPDALIAALRMPLALDYRNFDAERDKVNRGLFEGSWFQLLADAFGVSRGEMEQRERRRLQRRRRLAAGTVSGIIAVLSVALVLTLLARNEAVRQRDLAEARRRSALARQLNVHAEAASDDGARGIQRALLLAVESVTAAWTVEGHELLLRLVDRLAAPPVIVDGPHRTPVLALAVGPGMVATESQDLVLVRDPETWKTIRALGAPAGGSLRAAAFSPDGRWLVAGCATHPACVWDTGDWQVRKPLDTGMVLRSAAFSPDARVLATVVVGLAEVQRFDTGTWSALPPVDVSGEGRTDVTGAAFTADGRFLVVKGRGHTHWWDVRGRRMLARSDGQDDWSFALDVGGSRVATQDSERRLQFIVPEPGGGGPLRLDVRPGQWAHRLAERPTPVFSADGRRLAVQTADELVVVLDPAGRREPVISAAGAALAFSADGTRLMSAEPDGRIRVTEVARPQRASIPVPAGVLDVALYPDGTRAALLEAGGTVRLLETAAGRVVGTVAVDASTTAVHFSRDGRWLLTVGRQDLRLFETARFEEHLHLHGEGPFDVIALTPEEHWLVVVDGGQLRRFEAGSWREAPAIKLLEQPEAVFVSPDGRRLATRSGPSWSRGFGLTHPSFTRVWDIATGAHAGWTSHEKEDIERMSGMTWARRAANATGEWTLADSGGDARAATGASTWPVLETIDDRRAAPAHPWLTSSNAAGVPLWRTAVARAARAHDDTGPKLAWSADGRWLATAGTDGTLRIWPLTTTDLTSDACARVMRNLSPEEWKIAIGDEPVRATCPESSAPAPAPRR